MNVPILKVLHVGVGNRGRWPLEIGPQTGCFESAGLCDTSPEFLTEARTLTGLPESSCYTDLETAIAASGADVLILCSPTVTHVPFSKIALAAGKCVLTEKGMAPNWEEAAGLIDFVRGLENGAKFAVAQNYRYQAMEQTVRRILHDSTHPMNPGVIYHVDYVHHRVRPEPRTLHFPFASVWDMSCHHFDNLMFWLGPIEAMTARAYAAPWSAYRHPNNTAAWLEMQNGTRVDYLHTHDAARSSLHIEFQGERGALWWDGTSLRFSMKPNENWGHCEPSLVPLDPEPGLPALLLDFYTYVTGGPEPGISGFQNLETMAACEMLVRSATLNTRITRTLLNYS